MIRGLFVLMLFQCLGEVVKIATGVVLPGAVIGLLLLLVMLIARGSVPEWLGTTSTGLIGQLALLLLPPSVGMFFLGAQLSGQWLAVVSAVVIGTVMTVLTSAVVMRWLVKISGKEEMP